MAKIIGIVALSKVLFLVWQKVNSEVGEAHNLIDSYEVIPELTPKEIH